MRSDEQTAEEVLLRTLVEVRATRRRRRVLKLALATSATLILGMAILPRPAPLPQGRQQGVATAQDRPFAPDETLAVMVWRDGAARLEWLGTEELGSIELQFSLDPVIAFADDDP
jgi:hypothetical protein